MITAAQCRAARALLNWTQDQLAERAGVGVVTVRQFELMSSTPRRATLVVIKAALETAGIEFLDKDGVRRR
jgi:transcriptional regulator with XRE-family HTH domain